MGCTDEEACFYADIPMRTFYDYQKDKPEFSHRKKLLKQSPIFKARKSVVEGLENDSNLALKYLERKKKDEFSLKQEHEHSSNPDKPLEWKITYHEADKGND